MRMRKDPTRRSTPERQVCLLIVDLLLTTTSIIKVVIGTGVISMPYALSHLGYVAGILLMVVVICFSQLASTFLIKAKNLSGHSNYPTIFHGITGNQCLKIIPALIFCVGISGVLITDVIILRGTIKHFVWNVAKQYGKAWVTDQVYLSKWIIVLSIAILYIPFVRVKKIQKLRYLSFIGTIGICCFMVFFVLNFFININ